MSSRVRSLSSEVHDLLVAVLHREVHVAHLGRGDQHLDRIGLLFRRHRHEDEWQVSDRRYFSIGSMARLDVIEEGEDATELLAAAIA